MTSGVTTTGAYVIDASQLSVIGNITTSGYIFGNGSQLTGVSGNGGGTGISLINGTTNLTTQPSGVANITISGTPNVVVWQTTGEYVTGLVSATGNIKGNYILGNGSQLTGIAASYGNANVVANLAALGTNPVSTTGNITGGYILGNGSQLTGIAASYGNANVVANLAALGTNPVSTTGSITAGDISATGNISGTYILGNGSQLTGITVSTTYGNANVVANLAALGSNPVSTTGNITGSYILGNGSQLTGIGATYGNANVVANLAALGSNPVSTTGNISGGLFTGNGAGLTNVASSPSAARVTRSVTTANLAVNANANVTVSGFKGYALYSIQVDQKAWVTVYSSVSARTADANRAKYTLPTPGSGAIAEVITTGAATQLITPAAIGFSSESPPTGNIQLKVNNAGTLPTTITVTLTLLQMES